MQDPNSGQNVFHNDLASPEQRAQAPSPWETDLPAADGAPIAEGAQQSQPAGYYAAVWVPFSSYSPVAKELCKALCLRSHVLPVCCLAMSVVFWSVLLQRFGCTILSCASAEGLKYSQLEATCLYRHIQQHLEEMLWSTLYPAQLGERTKLPVSGQALHSWQHPK